MAKSKKKKYKELTPAQAFEFVKSLAREIEGIMLKRLEPYPPSDRWLLWGRSLMLLFRYHFGLSITLAEDSLEKRAKK